MHSPIVRAIRLLRQGGIGNARLRQSIAARHTIDFRRARREPFYWLYSWMMSLSLSELDGAALAAKETAAEAQYRELCGRNLILEMTRGKQARINLI